MDEYRNSIEKDGALERRFQKVMVEPTSVEETMMILHNIKDRYESHHHVSYTEDATFIEIAGRRRYYVNTVGLVDSFTTCAPYIL